MKVLTRNPKHRTIFISLLAFVTVLAILLSGTVIMGQTINPTAPVQNSQTGQVVSIGADGTSVTIQSGDLKTITIKVDQNTEYNQTSLAPENLSGLLNLVEAFMGQGKLSTDALSTLVSITQATKSAGFSDIAVGDIIAAEPSSADPATSVLIVKITCVKGTLTAISDTSFVVTTTDGKALTLSWDTRTRFILEGLRSLVAGLNVNVVYDKATNLALIAVVSTPSTSPSPTASPSASSPANTGTPSSLTPTRTP